ncbi:MAG: CoA transferase, partial [Pseudomonadota bacterium]
MLAGLRVLELGQNVAGPHASQILADLGAEVIKIERPGGEEGRRLGPPFVGDDAAWYHHINRGKKSVTIDLKDISQRDSLIALIGGADVFIHNSRPGVMARFGLDAATMRARFPRLIYADISAFGSRGPLADRPGYELLMQAYGGLMSITGGPDAPPTRMAPSMVDLGTGMWVAIGILAALVRRGVTGTGAHVEASLLETALDFSAIHIVNYLASRAMPQRSTDGFPGLVPYGGMRCSDGSLIVGAGNDRLFAKLATTLGRPEWAIDPRFANNAARVEHRAELHA